MKLSIVVTALNEQPFELNQTIASIRETAEDKPEIIVVDDCSSTPVECEDKTVRVIHNRWRCGVGPSRTIGVEAAKGEFVILMDSHMRMTPGWYETLIARLEGRSKTVHCTTCLGLDRDHMDVNAPAGVYHGARLNVFGPDDNKAGRFQILEGVWNKDEPADDAEQSCVMGANYALSREWFLKMDALRCLKFWAGDEQALSIKSWLMGGDVRFIKPVRIGHVFWKEIKPIIKKQFTVPPGYANFNKLFLIHSLMPADLAENLASKLLEHEPNGDTVSAVALLRSDWRIVATEKARNERLFVHDFRWFASKFSLPLP